MEELEGIREGALRGHVLLAQLGVPSGVHCTERCAGEGPCDEGSYRLEPGLVYGTVITYQLQLLGSGFRRPDGALTDFFARPATVVRCRPRGLLV